MGLIADAEQAKAMREALDGLGLNPSLLEQLKIMLPSDAIPLMRQLIDAEPTVIRKLNAAGLTLWDEALRSL